MSDIPVTPLIPSIWYAHGLYNTVVFLLFAWQGWLGSKIRIERLGRGPRTTAFITKHRKFGPVLTLLGIAGFLSGAIIVYFVSGHIFYRQVHFIAGSVLTILIITVFLISRKIRERRTPFRTLHMATGIATICLYLLQIYIGVGMLF